MTEPPPLSINEAAAALSVSRWTVYRLHRDGKLRFVKVRGGTRVRVSEIERYLRAAERNAA
jgi:excisionase family DNA binding protein